MREHLEQGYRRMPGGAARLYDFLTTGDANKAQVRQIAEAIGERVPAGRALDVGIGPGRLLLELSRRYPRLRLVGLELSPAMLELARRNLASAAVELRLGSIEGSGLEADSFDIVTCTGSLYSWRSPVRCLDEIHRLLKPGGRALLFETYREYDRLAYLRGLASIFAEQGLSRGLLSPLFLTQQLQMTYGLSDYEELASGSRFGEEGSSIRRVTLAELPIWAQIELFKTGP